MLVLYAESVVRDDIPRLDSVVKLHIQKAIERKLSIEHRNKSVLIVSIDHRRKDVSDV